MASLDLPDQHVTTYQLSDKTPSEENNKIILKQVLLDFEGLGNQDEILDFYNGGKSKDGFSGEDSGISFKEGAVSISESLYGGSGKLNLEDLSSTVLSNLAGNRIVMNIEAGFISGLSFRFIASDTGSVYIFNDLDGKGRILADKTFKSTSNQHRWERLTVNFDDTARSVMITCRPGRCVFDEIALGYQNQSGPGNSGSRSKLTKKATLTKKGNLSFSVLTRLGFNTGKKEAGKGGSSIDGYESGYYNLDFLPKAGYFITDNFVCGLFTDIELYNNKPKTETVYGYNGTTISLGPFTRYYFTISDKIIPFAEAQAGFGFDIYNSRPDASSEWMKKKTSLTSCRIGGGAVFFLTGGFGVDIFLGYLRDYYQNNKLNNTGRSIESNSKHDEFIMQIGVSLVIDQ